MKQLFYICPVSNHTTTCHHAWAPWKITAWIFFESHQSMGARVQPKPSYCIQYTNGWRNIPVLKLISLFYCSIDNDFYPKKKKKKNKNNIDTMILSWESSNTYHWKCLIILIPYETILNQTIAYISINKNKKN